MNFCRLVGNTFYGASEGQPIFTWRKTIFFRESANNCCQVTNKPSNKYSIRKHRFGSAAFGHWVGIERVGGNRRCHPARIAGTAMLDIYAGIAIMVCFSGLFFAFTLIVSSRFPEPVLDFLALLTFVTMGLYIAYLWDKAELTWLVPYSNAIIVGNWFPIITAVFSALIFHRVPPNVYRRYGMIVVLNLVGIYALIQPILGTPPVCHDQVDDFLMARQTSQVSCSPTSAVNLLAQYKIDAKESEMARLCLTRSTRNWLGLKLGQGGTSWMGLYRGLKLKLATTHLEPRFFSVSYQRFMKDLPDYPLILSLKLSESLHLRDAKLFDDLIGGGWQPGVEHNVVYLGPAESRSADGSNESKRVAIIDPFEGYEEIAIEKLEALWVGRGIYLESR